MSRRPSAASRTMPLPGLEALCVPEPVWDGDECSCGHQWHAPAVPPPDAPAAEWLAWGTCPGCGVCVVEPENVGDCATWPGAPDVEPGALTNDAAAE